MAMQPEEQTFPRATINFQGLRLPQAPMRASFKWSSVWRYSIDAHTVCALRAACFVVAESCALARFLFVRSAHCFPCACAQLAAKLRFGPQRLSGVLQIQEQAIATGSAPTAALLGETHEHAPLQWQKSLRDLSGKGGVHMLEVPTMPLHVN